MNEGRQITKEQAEACLKDDWQFEVRAVDVFRISKSDILQYYNNAANEWRYPLNSWRNASKDSPFNQITIHADPNDTFGRLFGEERELTFEEVGAALFRREIVKVIFPDKADALIKLAIERGQLEVHESNDNGKTWGQGFLPDDKWKYTLYKEPTPQPEPLSLESLDARLRKLEGNS